MKQRLNVIALIGLTFLLASCVGIGGKCGPNTPTWEIGVICW